MMLIWERRHAADPTDRRLYKGGDGGAGDMRQMEEERQAKVQAAVNEINRTFGIKGNGGGPPTREQFQRPSGGGLRGLIENVARDPDAEFAKATADYEAAGVGADANRVAREGLYTDIQGAVKDTAIRGLDRQFTDASRKNTFGLARSGLLGGSVDAEAGGELTELYGEGRLKATQAGDQAASDLRANDEKTRQNLIGLAQSGLDTGTASSMAAGQMGAAADLARSQTAGANVGRLFDDMGQAYLMNQQVKGRFPNGVPQPASGGYGSNLFGTRGYSGTVQK